MIATNHVGILAELYARRIQLVTIEREEHRNRLVGARQTFGDSNAIDLDCPRQGPHGQFEIHRRAERPGRACAVPMHILRGQGLHLDEQRAPAVPLPAQSQLLDAQGFNGQLACVARGLPLHTVDRNPAAGQTAVAYPGGIDSNTARVPAMK